MGATAPGLHARLTASSGTCRLDVELAVPPGGIVAVVGPNGAGKTTLLRALAGLQPLSTGGATLDGRPLEGEPEDRPVGMVFQDFRLLPHLSALDNVAFALRTRGARRAEARRRAADWLERLGVADVAGSRPAALSGGQAQRVALARALAPEPRLLLLDEPFSALDAKAAPVVRELLRSHLASAGGVGVLVTHDPLEAMALAGRLVVLENGRVTQSGSVADIAGQPRSAYVAELVGINLFEGRARGASVVLAGGTELVTAGRRYDEGAAVFALVHPRAVVLHRDEPRSSARNAWAARVAGSVVASTDPADDRVRLRVEGKVSVVAEITAGAARELDLSDGSEVWVSVKASEVVVYPV